MQRFEGKSLEDALTQAAQSLGVERYQIKHAVLLEKRGFLGGFKRVVIEAEVNADAKPPATPVASASPVAATSPAAAAPVSEARPSAPPRRERAAGRSGGGAGGRAGGRGRSGGGGGGGGRRRKRYVDDDDDVMLQPGDFAAQFGEEVPEQGAESETAAAVRAWCEKVLSIAKLGVILRTEENETQVIVRMYGPDTPRLVDRHGELLDALQVLANKSLTGRKVEKDIELDCESFKEQRVADLQQRARDVADRVREDGREQLLPAMSPIERRIVHVALAEDADVTTESRGDGFYKRVAIVRRAAPESDSRES
jgi:predicted RNA-binding protein Jag